MAAQAAAVYKWTDENGVVHYSDQPAPGAEKIFTGTTNVSASGAPSAAATPQRPAPAARESTFAITSPTPEQSFFGDEVITVHLTMEPALNSNQSITWHLNGKELDDQSPTSIQFTLQGLERGTYVIAATVVDRGSGESRNTGGVTFYVRQPSIHSPQHRNP